MIRAVGILAVIGLIGTRLAAQAIRLTVRVTAERLPVADAVVRVDTLSRTTDARGLAAVDLPAGRHLVHVSQIGFEPDSIEVVLRAGADSTLEVTMVRAVAEIEELIVNSTRSFRRVEDQPLRVEVLSTEEVEEKLLMTPGDITMLLNETPGIRVQATSSSLGGAAIRVQGLRGRYTLVLADGLPLFGSQVGGLGPLQIPPMDLGQVEVIKGSAAALYGPAALGGVINLISRDPPPGSDLLLNATTLGGVDGMIFPRGTFGGGWRYSVLAGIDRQARHDRNEDGWTDVPGFRRTIVRPRIRWSDAAGHSLLVTGGVTIERREGGTEPGRVAPDGHPFAEDLDSDRGDLGAVARWSLGARSEVTARASGATQRHRHRFGPVAEPDRHTTALAEASVLRRIPTGNVLLGTAVELERYRSDSLPDMNYDFSVPALFAQLELEPARPIGIAASARLDGHTVYGTFLSPRLSALVRPAAGWNLRASIGTGFFAPTPFVEQTEQTGLSRLRPWRQLRAEEAVTASLDLGATRGPLEVNLTAFASSVHHAVQLREVAGSEGEIELINAPRATRVRGTDLLARLRSGPVGVTASYTFTGTKEPDPETGATRAVPLTPRHAASIVASWERSDAGRIGVEVYYTGRQGLDQDPFRLTSRPFTLVGLLVERVFGRYRVFVNGENLTNRRQSRIAPLVRPVRAPDGRWTTDVWGSLEGRVVNAGLRVQLGAGPEDR